MALDKKLLEFQIFETIVSIEKMMIANPKVAAIDVQKKLAKGIADAVMKQFQIAEVETVDEINIEIKPNEYSVKAAPGVAVTVNAGQLVATAGTAVAQTGATSAPGTGLTSAPINSFGKPIIKKNYGKGKGKLK